MNAVALNLTADVTSVGDGGSALSPDWTGGFSKLLSAFTADVATIPEPRSRDLPAGCPTPSGPPLAAGADAQLVRPSSIGLAANSDNVLSQFTAAECAGHAVPPDAPVALTSYPAHAEFPLSAAQLTARQSTTASGTADPAPDADRQDTDPANEPASWTMQQALAAIAVIASAPAHSPQDLEASLARATGISPPSSQTKLIDDVSEKSVAAIAAQLTAITDPQPSIIAAAVDPRLVSAAVAHSRLSTGTADGAPASSLMAPESDLQQLDALVRDIAAVSGATGRAAFRLTADQLGSLEVRLHSSDAGLAVTIRTHDDEGHHAVAHAQQQLSDDLRGNGVKVAATNILMGGGSDRQRQERPQAYALVPIEARPPEDDQSPASTEQRPAGRYA